MTWWKMVTFAVAVLALLASGCGDEGGGAAGSGGMAGAGGTAGTGGSPIGTGSATLTIGDETWEFDSFQCAFGYDATQSQIFSFSSNAFGEDSGGARVQFQVDIEDDSGQERFEGAGVIFGITLDDIEDFENPSVSWEARGPDPEVIVQIDGDRVTAQGVFDDGLTDLVIEEVPGTVDATCGSQSIR
jgi:hypothetical protein